MRLLVLRLVLRLVRLLVLRLVLRLVRLLELPNRHLSSTSWDVRLAVLGLRQVALLDKAVLLPRQMLEHHRPYPQY